MGSSLGLYFITVIAFVVQYIYLGLSNNWNSSESPPYNLAHFYLAYVLRIWQSIKYNVQISQHELPISKNLFLFTLNATSFPSPLRDMTALCCKTPSPPAGLRSTSVFLFVCCLLACSIFIQMYYHLLIPAFTHERLYNIWHILRLELISLAFSRERFFYG